MTIQLLYLIFSLFCAFGNIVHYMIVHDRKKRLFYILKDGKIRKLHGTAMMFIAFATGLSHVISQTDIILQFTLLSYIIVTSVDSVVQRHNKDNGLNSSDDSVIERLALERRK